MERRQMAEKPTGGVLYPPGSGYYNPSSDRRALYILPRRARFWPGSDEMQGEQWQRCYGDIAIPQQLQQPRRRPTCLQDERRLEDQLVQSMRRQREQQEEYGQQLKARRGLRASSVEPTARAAERPARSLSQNRSDAVEKQSEHLLNKLRSAKVALISEQDCLLTKERVAAKEASKYLQSVKMTAEQRSTKQVTGFEQHQREESRMTQQQRLPRWAANHPIQEPTNYRIPPPDTVWPERRPFYDLKNDYNAMLSFVGVPKL